jgi:hypothetical protein
MAGTEMILPGTISLQVNRPASNGADVRRLKGLGGRIGVRKFRVKPNSLSTSIRSSHLRAAKPWHACPTNATSIFSIFRDNGGLGCAFVLPLRVELLEGELVNLNC